MARRIILVGHCGGDSTYLRLAVKAALGDATFVMADDNASLEKTLGQGADLVLLNRELGYGFEPDMGVEMIRSLREKYPEGRFMLISNYPQVQEEAVKAGAVVGFGKREIGSPRVAQLLRDALAAEARS